MHHTYSNHNNTVTLILHNTMERWSGRVALVTGASSGIGEATATKLVHLGMTVVGCARNIESIQVRCSLPLYFLCKYYGGIFLPPVIHLAY